LATAEAAGGNIMMVAAIAASVLLFNSSHVRGGRIPARPRWTRARMASALSFGCVEHPGMAGTPGWCRAARTPRRRRGSLGDRPHQRFIGRRRTSLPRKNSATPAKEGEQHWIIWMRPST